MSKSSAGAICRRVALCLPGQAVAVFTHSERGTQGRRGGRSLLRACLLASSVLTAAPALAQTFVPQGAAPGNASGVTDPASHQTFTGSTSALIVDPNNAGTLLVGSVNGGIFRTTNAGAADGNVAWSSQTGGAVGLSIASLAIDPANPLNMIAGVGPISNGASTAGPLTGVMVSTNGGIDWTTRTVDGVSGLGIAGSLGITASAISGTTLLVGSSSLSDATAAGGLFRSSAGGAFQAVALPGQDANAPVTSIVRGTSASPDVFVAAGGGSGSGAPTIYKGTIDGSTWTAVSTTGPLAAELATKSAYVANDATQRFNTVLRLASGPGGTIAAAVIKLTLNGNDTKATVQSIYLSNDNGANWNKLVLAANGTALQINTGGQGLTNLALAVDPRDSKTVYVAGDTSATATNAANAFVLPVFKLTLNADNTTSVTDLSILGSNNSAVHPDARFIGFDANNRMIVGNDGGIYALGTDGKWHGLNGNLQLGEYYQVAFDSRSKRIAAAAQDNGVQFQNASGKTPFSLVAGGDGINVSVADKAGPNSTLYGSLQNLSLFRATIDAATGKLSAFVSLRLFDGATQINPDGEGAGAAPFGSKFALNMADQKKFAVGTRAVYVGTDDPANAGTPQGDGSGNFNITVTKVGDIDANNSVTALAYGVTGNPDAVLAGTDGGKLFLSDSGTAASLAELGAYRAAGGWIPTAVLFDPRTVQRFFSADSTSLWATRDKGVTFTSLDGSLPVSFVNPRGLAFVAQNGVNALFVGGVNAAAGLGNQVAVASSKADGTLYNPFTLDTTGRFFSRFGAGLPNAPVYNLYYSEGADTLVAGTFGRGAWTVYDVTSFFPQATALWFGKADNDSQPTAAQLANGKDENGTAFDRGLSKSGAGTLTIAGGVTAGYRGPTALGGGTMVVDGSIVSSSGLTATAGMLMGTGIVPVTRIATGAMLRPGSAAGPTGTLTVAGNLTLDAGSVYSVQIMGANAAKTTVTGSTSIAGGFQAVGLGGNYVFNTPYTVLTSNGRTGEFGATTSSNLSAVTVNLTYDPNNVFITLGPNLAGAVQGAPSTSNENRVAVAIDGFVTRGGRLPAKFQNLYAESGDELADELDEVAGVNDSGGVHAAFKLTNAFLQLMLNPFAAGPGGNPADSGASRAFAAADRALSPKAAAAYAAVRPVDTRHAASRWGIWAQPYGGWNKTKGDFDLGLPDTSARAYGLATGFDYRVDPDTLVGFALAGAGTSWSVYGMPQGGRSDAFQLGLYGSRSFGPAYVAAAVSYAWHKVTTDRTIEATGDQLRAEFDAHSLGARLEAGYRVPTAYVNIIPYGAVQAQTYKLPAYSEFAVAGDDTFALSSAARTVNALRTELGAWLERSVPLTGGSRMTLRTRAAWAHDRSSDASVELAFKTLPEVGFVDAPAKQAPDALLLTAGAELRLPNGLSIGGKIDGEFASGSRTYAGSAIVRFEW